MAEVKQISLYLVYVVFILGILYIAFTKTPTISGSTVNYIESAPFGSIFLWIVFVILAALGAFLIFKKRK
jgi:hypothetical protein